MNVCPAVIHYKGINGVLGKDNLTTLAPPAPTGRSQHAFRQCPLDAEIVSHLN